MGYDPRKTVRDYTGIDIPKKDMDVFPDPKVPGTYAVRVRNFEGRGEDQCFLVYGTDVDTEIEEAEFTEWPPISGELKFFM